MTNVGYQYGHKSNWLQKPPLGVQLKWGHPLTKGLVGCWLFNEGGGDKAYDLSGYGNHGTLKNMAFPPTITSGWNPSKDGIGLAFDGNNNYLDCGNDPSLNITDAITIEACVKPALYQADAGVIGKKYSYDFGIHQSKITFGYYLSQADNIYSATTQDVVNNEWNHLVVSYTLGTGSSIKLFWNGQEVSGSWIHGDGTATPPTNSEVLKIGRDDYFADYFNGLVHYVKLYNRTLRAQEIQQLYIDSYSIVEPATKYTIIDERLRTKHVGSNVSAMQMLRGRTVI